MIETANRVDIPKPMPTYSRVLGEYSKGKKGPLIVVIAGIHGNEATGCEAVKEVIDQVKSLPKFKGKIVAISGNVKALNNNARFLAQDLNRTWTYENITALQHQNLDLSNPEFEEMKGLNDAIEALLTEPHKSKIFIDLHTTSSQTVPFITMNDSIINRDFCQKFPIPIVMGIEEVLSGTLLSYLNEIGFVGFGFEAGQHTDPLSVDRHKAFLWHSLAFAGCMKEKQIPNRDYYWQLLNHSKTGKAKFYEVLYRHNIEANHEFQMKPGYVNFSSIKRNEKIAKDKYGDIKAPKKSSIFMPLYQAQGNDGFFIVGRVRFFWLKISKFLRRIRFDIFLVWLPGIERNPSNYYSLIVNARIARFLRNEIFHLLGYRKKQQKGKYLLFTKRDFNPRKKVLY